MCSALLPWLNQSLVIALNGIGEIVKGPACTWEFINALHSVVIVCLFVCFWDAAQSWKVSRLYTGSSPCPTGLSSRWWLEWLIRTPQEPLPCLRGRRPAWTSSNRSSLDPTQTLVRPLFHMLYLKCDIACGCTIDRRCSGLITDIQYLVRKCHD